MTKMNAPVIWNVSVLLHTMYFIGFYFIQHLKDFLFKAIQYKQSMMPCT